MITRQKIASSLRFKTFRIACAQRNLTSFNAPKVNTPRVFIALKTCFTREFDREMSNVAKQELEPEKEVTVRVEPATQSIPEQKTQDVSKEKEIATLKDQYLRSVANFRNLQTRSERDIQQAKEFAIQKFVKDILESLDTLAIALKSVPKEKLTETNKELWDFYTGIEMTQNALFKTLERNGVAQFDGLGEKFDPNIHEATFELFVKDKDPGIIFHCESKGYTLNGRTIRPAKVGVVKDES